MIYTIVRLNILASGSTPSRREILDYAPQGRFYPPAWELYGLEAGSERNAIDLNRKDRAKPQAHRGCSAYASESDTTNLSSSGGSIFNSGLSGLGLSLRQRRFRKQKKWFSNVSKKERFPLSIPNARMKSQRWKTCSKKIYKDDLGTYIVDWLSSCK